MSIEIESMISNEQLVKGIAIIPYGEGIKYEKSGENRKNNTIKEIFPVENSKIRYFYGAQNNLPDIFSVNATKHIIEMCKQLNENDILLALISGGGSALLTQPIDLSSTNDAHENLRLKLDVIKSLVKSGADINELNSVRSCLSSIKGGNLALLAKKATIITLIISDVISDSKYTHNKATKTFNNLTLKKLN